MDHYDVLIATPGAMLEAQYVKSLVETLAECDKRGISYRWLNAYSSLVHHARELTITGSANQTLDPNNIGPLEDEATYNKIIWIDSDIAWSIDDFFKLYDSDLDILSGAYILADGFRTTIQEADTLEILTKEDIARRTDIFEAHAIGFGFVAIKQGVFENMERPWFKYFPQPVIRADGSTIYDSMGEDLTWCLSAKNAGYKIHIDPTVKVDHLKKTRINWKDN